MWEASLCPSLLTDLQGSSPAGSARKRDCLGKEEAAEMSEGFFPRVVGVAFSRACASSQNTSPQVSGFIRDLKLSAHLPEDVSKVTFLHETGLIYCLCGFIEHFWLLFSLFFFFFSQVNPDGLSWDLFWGFEELKSPHAATLNGAAL